eukprot:6046877-Prymnesium_polylepis.1
MAMSSLTMGASIAFNYKLQKAQHATESTAYFVLEHAPRECSQLPPNGIVTWSNISVAVNGKPVARPVFRAAQESPACGSKVEVLSPSTIKLSWDATAQKGKAAEEMEVEVEAAASPASVPAREVFAFCTTCSVALLGQRLDIITTIAAFGTPDPELVALAHSHTPRVRVVVGCDFDKAQLGNATARAAWVAQQVAHVQTLAIDGLNLDIEGNSAQRDGLTALVAELRTALSAANPEYQLSFDLGISPKAQASGYDHRSLSISLNFTLPMAYDECWGSPTATANSPIGRLVQGIGDYASLGVPAEKLVMGLPWYGWDFPCDEPHGPGCAVHPPPGQPWFGYARQLGYDEIKALANRSVLQPTAATLDAASMTKRFDYFEQSDGKGSVRRHSVWYDDAETLAAKYEAAAKHGARGVAMWTANFGDDAMWAALRKFREGANHESPTVAPTAALCVAENGGTGEDPPPMGSLTRVDATSREKRLIAKGLQDPVWVTSEGGVAYVGLFHAGTIVRVDLADGTTKTV